jgi:hypothetical protein
MVLDVKRLPSEDKSECFYIYIGRGMPNSFLDKVIGFPTFRSATDILGFTVSVTTVRCGYGYSVDTFWTMVF